MLELVFSVLLQLSVVFSGDQSAFANQRTTIQKSPKVPTSVSTSAHLNNPTSIGSTGWDDKD